MKKYVAEELPVRSHPQSSLSLKKDNAPKGGGGGNKTSEEKISQAASDIRYRARREDVPLRTAYSQYMQNSSMSESEKLEVRNKLFGKGGTMGEDYNIKDFAATNVANAMFKVFIEGKDNTIGEEYIQELKKDYIKKEIGRVDSGAGNRKYKVRVTDKNGTSYVRYATRDKISDLRSNPNIKSVEMTEYGKPYEGEREKGSQTASALGGGKAKKDYDHDGKIESPAKEHAGAVHNAIQRKKGGIPDGKDTSSVKEEFLNPKTNQKKNQTIDLMPTGKKNKVTVSPSLEKDLSEEAVSSSQRKFMGLVHAYQKNKLPNASDAVKKAAQSMSKSEVLKFAKTKEAGLPKHVGDKVKLSEMGNTAIVMRKKKSDNDNPHMTSDLKKINPDDPRAEHAKDVKAANLLHAMGMKKVMVIPTEENIGEGAGLSVGISKLAGNLLSNPRTSPEQGAKNFQKNLADPVGKAVKGAVRSVLQPANMSPEAQKARRDKYRPEEVEFEGEMIDERRREDKGTPRKPRNRAFELVSNSMGTDRMGVKPRGQKKEPGKKPPAAGESGGPISPAQKVKRNRDIVKRGEENMSSRFD
jgi:hypothetical protein